MSNMAAAAVPPGWCKTTLADVSQPRGGKADPQSTPHAPFIGMEHVEPHTTRLLGTVPAGTMKSGANVFEAGDVLYGRMRSYLNKVHQPDFGGLCSGEFIVLPESPAVLGRFLKYRLSAGDFVRFASRINTGDRPRVDFGQIGSFPVLLPPRNEQARIADALDELLSDLDAGVASLEAARAKVKAYRASVLKAAVDGTLTAAWRAAHPDAEPAAALLGRILAERRRRWEEEQLARFEAKGQRPPNNWRAKYVEPVASDPAELPSLPNGWCGTTVDQIAYVGTGATPNRGMHARYYDAGTVPWVTSSCVNQSTVREPSAYVTAAALAECNLTLYPPGTLLLAMYGEGKTRGKAAELAIESATNQALAALVTVADVKPYLKVFLAKNYDEVRRAASGGVQPNLNLGLVREVVLPLPPAAEQDAIVELVEDQLSVVDHLEADLAAKLASAQALRQSVLRHAFTGRLVPQDPADEPAAALLVRIAAERAERGEPRSSRRRRQSPEPAAAGR